MKRLTRKQWEEIVKAFEVGTIGIPPRQVDSENYMFARGFLEGHRAGVTEALAWEILMYRGKFASWQKAT